LLTVALEPRQALMLSVVDANAVPVAGARVAIRAEGVGSIDWPSESDASGVVEVHGLPQDDDSELIVDAEERDLGSARLRVSAGVLRSRPEIVLEPYAAIAGIVVDETGSPVAGARVVIIDSDRALRTTADGRFELRGLARGSYRVAASTIDRGTSDVAEVEITAADVVDLTLELRRGPASIRGHIVDSGDRAVALAEVALRAGEITFLTASAADGAFAFEGVPESDAVLSAVDGSGARATLRVASGDQAVRLRLAPPGDVVAAVDFAGATEDFRVDLVALDGAPKRTFRFSSESPLFHLRGVSTGEYRLEVRSASGAEIGQVEKLTVRSGNRTGPFLIGAEP